MLQQAIINVNNKFAKVSKMVNDEAHGINPRMVEMEETIYTVEEENRQLRFELDIAKGLISKQNEEIGILRNRLTTMAGRSMRNNITIGGLPEKEGEKPKVLVKEFLKDKMEVVADMKDLKIVHRMGSQHNINNPRIMVAKCTHDLKEKIFKKKSALKDQTNEMGKGYFISKQIPDEWAEEQRDLREAIKKAKQVNATKEQEGMEKDVIQVKNRILYINKEPQRKLLAVPKPAELFVEKTEQDKIDRMKFYSSDSKTEEGSYFTAHVVKTQSMTEIRRAYIKVRQMHPSASHIPFSFRFKNVEGSQDDREIGASSRMLKTMQNNNIINMCVFVVRYYGGKHLGPKRHKIIENVLLEATAKALSK